MGPEWSDLNSPEDTGAQQNYQTFIFPCAFYLSPKMLFTLQWTDAGCRYSQLRTGSGRQHGERRNESKRGKPKPLISREAEASADYKPKCPAKDSRGCSLYVQQHFRECGEGKSGHEEKKAPHFLTPAIIAEGCKAFSHLIQGLFTSFYIFFQKASAQPPNNPCQLQVRIEVLIFSFCNVMLSCFKT